MCTGSTKYRKRHFIDFSLLDSYRSRVSVFCATIYDNPLSDEMTRICTRSNHCNLARKSRVKVVRVEDPCNEQFIDSRSVRHEQILLGSKQRRLQENWKRETVVLPFNRHFRQFKPNLTSSWIHGTVLEVDGREGPAWLCENRRKQFGVWGVE